jgi:hypothetical protein
MLKASQGKANPEIVNEILKAKIVKAKLYEKVVFLHIINFG